MIHPRSLHLLPTLSDASSGSAKPTLIDRYAGRDDDATCLCYVIPEQLRPNPPHGVMLVDTSVDEDPLPRMGSTGGSIWHVIWVSDEANASATVNSPGGTFRWPIAPGDSVGVPAGAGLRIIGGQLGLLITDSTHHTPHAFSPPTHGIDDFHGHNRRTTYPMLGGIATHRWKITQPLDLSRHHDRPVIVVSLAGDLTIASPTESLTLSQGQAVIADPERAITIYPAGLAYVYTITW